MNIIKEEAKTFAFEMWNDNYNYDIKKFVVELKDAFQYIIKMRIN